MFATARHYTAAHRRLDARGTARRARQLLSLTWLLERTEKSKEEREKLTAIIIGRGRADGWEWVDEERTGWRDREDGWERRREGRVHARARARSCERERGCEGRWKVWPDAASTMHRGPPSTPGSDPPHNPPALYDQSILFYIVSRETNRLRWFDSFGATLSSMVAAVHRALQLPDIFSRPSVAERPMAFLSRFRNAPEGILDDPRLKSERQLIYR